MTQTGLYVLTKPSGIYKVLPFINKYVGKTLYIQYLPSCQNLHSLGTTSEISNNLCQISQSVINIYSQTTSYRHGLDIRVLLSNLKKPVVTQINTRRRIEVIFFDEIFKTDEINHYMTKYLKNVEPSCKVVTLDESCNLGAGELVVEPLSENTFEKETKICHKVYDNVVLGGTFDRLHTGHRILFTEAILRCSRKLTVGVTDTCMLKSKKLWELIEPCSTRISSVEDFLIDVEPNLNYEVVPIDDPFGPTKEDPELQMIVVSAETHQGGLKVNNLRKERGLPLLDIHVVDLFEPLNGSRHKEEESKISSSNERMNLLGERLKIPKLNTNIPQHPYIIGLTGNIASGKSSVAKRLEKLGAGLINCDTIAHCLYKKGKPCYKALLTEFGNNILDTNEEIDRKVLGTIVFQDKEQLVKLNNLVWPLILEASLKQAEALYTDGHEIVVMEAAVLLQAGWDAFCHEVWACIITEQEAVKRLCERNGLTESDAKDRLASQISNVEQVAKAHVVISTLWDPEFTQLQVEKAWTQLQIFLQQLN